MKKSIWKYDLEIDDEQSIDVPEGAKMLTAQIQKGNLCVWAIVDPRSEKKPRKFYVFGTGHHNDFAGKDYLGTVQIHEGNLVFHVFVESD